MIGQGSPNKAGTHKVHGAPLGDEEIALTREAMGWTSPAFEIPDDIYSAWDNKEAGAAAEQAWDQRFAAYQAAYPELAAEFIRRMAGELPADFAQRSAEYIAQTQEASETIASRKASQQAIETYAAWLPELMGGSADLAGSNLTLWSGSQPLTGEDASGNYIYYGVREFGMAAIMNGLALHGGFIPYGGTFLIFMEYARNAVRMAALMRQRSIFVFTHDSIGLGEDGPTHQPIEQLANLRSTPNMYVWRPCDATESAVAWQQALLRHDAPSSLIFSRQGLPAQARSEAQVADVARGGYVLQDCEGTPDLILMATGSEVGLAADALAVLSERGHKVRLVSMPCVDAFLEQDISYQEQVLPSEVDARLAIEAGVPDGWYRFVGRDGRVLGMTTFGESAPAKALKRPTRASSEGDTTVATVCSRPSSISRSVAPAARCSSPQISDSAATEPATMMA